MYCASRQCLVELQMVSIEQSARESIAKCNTPSEARTAAVHELLEIGHATALHSREVQDAEERLGLTEKE